MDEQPASDPAEPRASGTDPVPEGGHPLPAPPPQDAEEPADPGPTPPLERPWTPTPTAAFQATPVHSDVRRAGIAAMAGAALVVVGWFLPWLTSRTPGVPLSVSGLDVHEWWFLILAAIALVRASVLVRDPRDFVRAGRAQPRIQRVILGVAIDGGLLAWLLYTRYQDIDEAIRAGAGSGLDLTVGIGFWLAVVGTAGMLVACLFAYIRGR